MADIDFISKLQVMDFALENMTQRYFFINSDQEI